MIGVVAGQSYFTSANFAPICHALFMHDFPAYFIYLLDAIYLRHEANECSFLPDMPARCADDKQM